jgi:hypothetical protein
MVVDATERWSVVEEKDCKKDSVVEYQLGAPSILERF